MADISTPHQYEAYIRKNETWNFVVNTVDMTSYFLALSFIHGSTILSLYASHLTDSAALIGLISAIQGVGSFLPQLLISRRAEQVPHKKTLVQKISVMERLPYLFIALTIMCWPQAPKWVAFMILAIGLTMAFGSGGLVGPAWYNMLAKVIPLRRRGLLFGLSNALSGLLGVIGAAASRNILATYPYPISFGICFALCFVFQAISWTFLSLNREPSMAYTKEALSPQDYWRKLPSVLRANPNFVRYLVSRFLIIMGTMATAFYVLYAREAFQISDASVAGFTMSALIAQTASAAVLGWLADRHGHKWLMELSTLVGVAAAASALLAPRVAWFYLVFALVNVSMAGRTVASMSMIMEFSDPEDIPTFSALASTFLGVPALVAPLIGGGLADMLGYRGLFVIAMVFLGLGWSLMHWQVREPRHERRT